MSDNVSHLSVCLSVCSCVFPLPPSTLNLHSADGVTSSFSQEYNVSLHATIYCLSYRPFGRYTYTSEGSWSGNSNCRDIEL